MVITDIWFSYMYQISAWCSSMFGRTMSNLCKIGLIITVRIEKVTSKDHLGF